MSDLRPGALSRHLRRIAWRSGRRLYAHARGESASADILTNGEAAVQGKVLAAVAPSGQFQAIDIGANKGDWTLSLLQLARARKLGAAIRIDAFEPVPATADRCERAFQAQPERDALRLHRCAVSDTTGRASMAILSESGGTDTLEHSDSSLTRAQVKVEVPLTTLPDFCDAEGIGHVHLVKCDAEGHDFKVVKGARRLLEAGRIDVLQFEYNFRWVFARCFLKDVFDLVEGLPYTVARVRTQRLEIFTSWHPEIERFFETNYVLVRRPALAWFEVHSGQMDSWNTYS
jgi:FkbM family methyltransferase